MGYVSPHKPTKPQLTTAEIAWGSDKLVYFIILWLSLEYFNNKCDSTGEEIKLAVFTNI